MRKGIETALSLATLIGVSQVNPHMELTALGCDAAMTCAIDVLDEDFSTTAYDTLECYLSNPATILWRNADLASKRTTVERFMQLDTSHLRPYKMVNYGPDVNNDGELRLVNMNGVYYNEQNQIVPELNQICIDYARQACEANGFVEAKNLSEVNIPMFAVNLYQGFNSEAASAADWGTGHSFNATFVGNNMRDIYSPNAWLFSEPQTDTIVDGDPFGHYMVPKAQLMTIRVPSEEEIGIGDPTYPQRDLLIGFFEMPDASWLPITPDQLRIVQQFSGWTFEEEVAHQKGHDPQFTLSEFNYKDVLYVANAAVQSGYLSAREVEHVLVAGGVLASR